MLCPRRLGGIPVDKLLLGTETEVQLADLAGNAMAMPVVSAAILAALLVPSYARMRNDKKSFDLAKMAPAPPLNEASASATAAGESSAAAGAAKSKPGKKPKGGGAGGGMAATGGMMSRAVAWQEEGRAREAARRTSPHGWQQRRAAAAAVELSY